MSKRKSLVRQFVEKLDSLACYGKSRYEAKEDFLSKIKADSVEGWQPISVEGIYSYETMRSYKKECVGFAHWARENFGVRDIEPAKAHVSSYLQRRLDKGDSAWTLQLRRAALRKLYQDTNLANEVRLPIRHKSEIVRSRGHKTMDEKFSVERNKELIDFCRVTGLRRHEIRALKVEDVYRADGRTWLYVRQGKGGRPRTVPVLKDLEERVLEVIAGKKSDGQVIEKIPVRADIHSYRRDYAKALYYELVGKEFNPKDKDLSAMQQVSCALGHNRLDIITRNYLG